jgi:hypothetical protein
MDKIDQGMKYLFSREDVIARVRQRMADYSHGDMRKDLLDELLTILEATEFKRRDHHFFTAQAK